MFWKLYVFIINVSLHLRDQNHISYIVQRSAMASTQHLILVHWKKKRFYNYSYEEY